MAKAKNSKDSGAVKQAKKVDTQSISHVIWEIQNQLRALVVVAQSDLSEESPGEVLQILCANTCKRAHMMLDDCLKEMGEGQVGGFENAFDDMTERTGVAHG